MPNVCHRKYPQVTASWALDTGRFNEWMCEEDYEVDEKGNKKFHPVSLHQNKITVPVR